MKNRISAALVLVAVPAVSLAHHSGEESLGAQLLHASFDPLHLGLSVLLVLGLASLAKLAARRGRSS